MSFELKTDRIGGSNWSPKRCYRCGLALKFRYNRSLRASLEILLPIHYCPPCFDLYCHDLQQQSLLGHWRAQSLSMDAASASSGSPWGRRMSQVRVHVPPREQLQPSTEQRPLPRFILEPPASPSDNILHQLPTPTE